MSIFTYNFPPCKAERDLTRQCKHLVMEAKEALAEAKRGNIIDCRLELMDVIHCAETALRMIENEDEHCNTEAKATVILKNKKRGYYEIR